MRNDINGLHHVTATVDQAQDDLDFFVGTLGLRLVKKTVNFDNNQVYHFYYGSERGSPGTIMTTFPYGGHGVRPGAKGTGQIISTSFAVPASAIDFWKSRLGEAGVSFAETSRFGEPVLSFHDRSSLELELIGVEADDRQPWTTDEISESIGVRGLQSVTLSLTNPAPTLSLLTEVLGFSVVGEEGSHIRLDAGERGPGGRLEIQHEPEREPGVNGIGTVHHVALAISDEAAQLRLRADLLDLGFNVSPVRDRHYFRSIYFRERGGVLFEVATLSPGFTVDEPLEALGRQLKLPERDEVNRSEIERALPRVEY